MKNSFWLNLPVKDARRSKAFYTEIGFRLNEAFPGGEDAVSFFVGKQDVVVMLFETPAFTRFAQAPVADASVVAEVLLSIEADSPEAVDALAAAAVAAGGTSSHQPRPDRGGMYGCLFADPDGHRWNVLCLPKVSPAT